jgi:hypothetical protein
VLPSGSAAGGTSSTAPLDVHSTIAPAPEGPRGLAPAGSSLPWERAGAKERSSEGSPRNVQVFFSVYFLMTGLHGLHVLAGMGLFGWILRRAIRGDFSSEYFTPVDLAALYWHLVDVIWIYLFPLLYLIR